MGGRRTSLFGIMTEVSQPPSDPAPNQQSVVTVNYTQLAMAGAQFVAGAVKMLSDRKVEVFDVSAQAEKAWTQKIVDSYVSGTEVMSACTPSRINNEGHPELVNPRDGNYGGGFGDWFGYRDLLEKWVGDGRFEGLILEYVLGGIVSRHQCAVAEIGWHSGGRCKSPKGRASST